MKKEKDKEALAELMTNMLNLLAPGDTFNYVDDTDFLIGHILSLKNTGCSMGSRNNLIGTPNDCANVFYTLILLYMCQIRDLLSYSSEQIVFELIKRLKNDVKYLDRFSGAITFRNELIHKPGSC